MGDAFRYRYGSCASVVAWRCTWIHVVSPAHSSSALRDSQGDVAGRGCVPDGVVGSQADPLGDRAVLLLSFRKLHLRAEGLVGLRIISIADRMGRIRCCIPAS